MTEFRELPLIINDLSQKKFNSYTIYSSKDQNSNHRSYKKNKKENKNPFKCLNRIPQNSNSFTTKNLKSLNQSRADLEGSSSFDFSNSLMNTLPPLTALTAPRGVALQAY